MKERDGRRIPFLMMRFHTQTAAAASLRREPENNIVRTAIEALAVLAAPSPCIPFHGRSAGPVTEKAVKIALRTQQIIV